MQTNFIRRKCDFCGQVKDFVKDNLTPEQSREMSNWITLVREYIINGQAIPVMKHGCKDSCAKNLIDTGTLILPPEFIAQRRN